MNNRTEQFHFFATPEEAKLIREREKEIGILNESAYLRKMAIDGYLIQMDLSDVKEAVRILLQSLILVLLLWLKWAKVKMSLLMFFRKFASTWIATLATS